MKSALIFVAFLAAIGVSLAYKPCKTQLDCDPDECCLDNMFFKRPFCGKRYQAESSCTPGVYKPEDDLYYLTCPCVQMYECLGKGVTENGITYMKDPKCIMPLF